MKIFQSNLFRFQADIIPEKGPWAALLLIPVTIISGAYWTSIPFYLCIHLYGRWSFDMGFG